MLLQLSSLSANVENTEAASGFVELMDSCVQEVDEMEGTRRMERF